MTTISRFGHPVCYAHLNARPAETWAKFERESGKLTRQMTTKFPLITIGITCFNAAATIERAVASALAQNWPNFEIIVVDDNSSDDSAAIVQRAIAGHPRARLIRHEKNEGGAITSNTIIEAAKGDFLVYFDDDDESAPDRIAIQCKKIRLYEKDIGASLIACYASGARDYPNGYVMAANAIGTRGRPPTGSEIVDYLLLNERKSGVDYGAGTPACALMARTATFREVGGFDPALRRVWDVDFSIRLGFRGAHFIGCKERLYLQHATVGVDKTPARNLEGELAIVEKYHDYLDSLGLYLYAKNWFVFRYLYFSRQYQAAFWQVAVIFARYPLRALRHLWLSAPARLRHEASMKRKISPISE